MSGRVVADESSERALAVLVDDSLGVLVGGEPGGECVGVVGLHDEHVDGVEAGLVSSVDATGAVEDGESVAGLADEWRLDDADLAYVLGEAVVGWPASGGADVVDAEVLGWHLSQAPYLEAGGVVGHGLVSPGFACS